jgi:hypothetical protein
VCITSSNPFPSVPGLYTAVAGSSIYRMTVFNYNCRRLINGGECVKKIFFY